MKNMSKLPDGWKEYKLSEIFDEVAEKNHPDADVLTIVQGIGTVLREDSGREIVYDKNSLANYKFVRKGDFIIHLRSFEGGLEVANQDGIVSPAYIILHPKMEVSTTYLYSLFHSNRFINQTMAPAVEGARDGRSVKYDVLKQQKIPFPLLPEQQKIAEILSTQDKIIELKEKLLEQKQEQKKYLVKKIMFASDEHNAVLADIIDLISIRSCASQNCYVSTENMISNYGGIIFSEEGQIVEGIAFRKDDILVANIRPYLKKVWRASIDGVCSADVLVFRAKKATPLYLYYLVANDTFCEYVMNGVKGTKMPRGDKKQILQMPLFIPTISEQQAIAEVLSTADKEIDLLKAEIEQEKLKKKSLMQLLLTGIVRVKV